MELDKNYTVVKDEDIFSENVPINTDSEPSESKGVYVTFIPIQETPLSINDKFELCFDYLPSGLKSAKIRELDEPLKKEYPYEGFRQILKRKKIAPYTDAIYEYLILKKAALNLKPKSTLKIEHQRDLIKVLIFLMGHTDSKTEIEFNYLKNSDESVKVKGEFFHVELMSHFKNLFEKYGLDLVPLSYVEAYNILNNPLHATPDVKKWVNRYVRTSSDYKRLLEYLEGFDRLDLLSEGDVTIRDSPSMVSAYALEHFKKHEITLKYLKEMYENIKAPLGARPKNDEIGLLSERLLYLIYLDDYIEKADTSIISYAARTNEACSLIFSILDYFGFLELYNGYEDKALHIRTCIKGYRKRKPKIFNGKSSHYQVEKSIDSYKQTKHLLFYFDIE